MVRLPHVIVGVLVFIAAGCATAPAAQQAAQPLPPGTSPRDGEAVRRWALETGWTEASPPLGGRMKGWLLIQPPTGQPHTPTAAERRRGAVLYVPDRDRLGAVLAPPRKPEAAAALTALAFPGEFEGLCLGVHALTDLDKVLVSVSHLTGPKGARIHGLDVRISDVAVAPFSLRSSRAKKNEFVMLPMWVIGHGRQGVQKGRQRLYWLRVKVGKGLPPGKYTGTVKVTAGEAVLGTKRIELDVQPFALDTSLCHWCPCTGGNGFDLPLYEQFAAHHMTGLSWWWGHWGLRVIREGDKAAIDPRPLDLLSAVTRAAGMRGPWVLMLGNDVAGHVEKRIGRPSNRYPHLKLFDTKPLVVPPRPKRKGHASVGDLDDPEMDKRFVEVMQSLERHAKAKGYPEIMLITYDEAHERLLKWHDRRAGQIRKNTGFKVLSTPQGSVKWAKDLMPTSDLMVARGGTDPIYKLTTDAGKGIVNYGRLTCNHGFVLGRHVLGLRFATQQGSAIFFWSLNFGRLDERAPFNDLLTRDSGARHRFAWPAGRGDPWIETLAWEGQREGAKDYLLLLMVEKALKAAKGEPATKIRAALEPFKQDAAVNPKGLDAKRAQLAKWYRALTP